MPAHIPHLIPFSTCLSPAVPSCHAHTCTACHPCLQYLPHAFLPTNTIYLPPHYAHCLVRLLLRAPAVNAADCRKVAYRSAGTARILMPPPTVVFHAANTCRCHTTPLPSACHLQGLGPAVLLHTLLPAAAHFAPPGACAHCALLHQLLLLCVPHRFFTAVITCHRAFPATGGFYAKPRRHATEQSVILIALYAAV